MQLLSHWKIELSWQGEMQGKVTNVKGEEHQIEYDDKWTEWLSLNDERFHPVSPRGTSAGCNEPLLVCNALLL